MPAIAKSVRAAKMIARFQAAHTGNGCTYHCLEIAAIPLSLLQFGLVQIGVGFRTTNDAISFITISRGQRYGGFHQPVTCQLFGFSQPDVSVGKSI